MGHAGGRQDDVHVDARRACSSAATRRGARQNIIWAVEHGHQAAISIHNHCQGVPVTERPAQGDDAGQHEDGAARVELQQRLQPGRSAQKMKHVELREALRELSVEVEMGFTPSRRAREVERCLNCDMQTDFTDKLCIECDACIDVCPVNCLTIAPNGDEAELRDAPHGAGRQPRAGAVRVRRRCRRPSG